MGRARRIPPIHPGDRWEVNLDCPPIEILTVDHVDFDLGRVYYTTGGFDVLLQFLDRRYMRPYKPEVS